jgi:hypothetical protein
MADGMAVNGNRFTNPEDNIVKNFLYQADKKVWIPQATPKNRLLNNGSSMIAAYDAIGYQNNVIFVGERGTII